METEDGDAGIDEIDRVAGHRIEVGLALARAKGIVNEQRALGEHGRLGDDLEAVVGSTGSPEPADHAAQLKAVEEMPGEGIARQICGLSGHENGGHSFQPL